MSSLPVIVSVGGYNAAGRSSGFVSYLRMIHESLSQEQKSLNIRALAAIMRIDESDSELEQKVLSGTLVRQLEESVVPPSRRFAGQKVEFSGAHGGAVEMTIPARDLPVPLPPGWSVLDKQSNRARISINTPMSAVIDVSSELPVQSAGQLPAGFNPGDYYRSVNHPRGLQLTVMGASDAVNSLGVSWSQVLEKVRPDQVGVYSANVMSQLDEPGLGGMMSARGRGKRVSSKQLPLGLNTMPADFINAYVLGSVGVTAGIAGACATFLYNLRAGAEDIKSGKRRVVMVGSSEAPILPEIIDGYSAMSALATDADLRKLDVTKSVNHRSASRPFGENCGFTLAESSQYILLMDDQLALELGAPILGAVPGVYVNADGYKKSISAPGPGNYLTMASAVSLAKKLVGDATVQHASFVQAHGSSTPHNRVSESLILDRIASHFGIDQWPVCAVKSYLGHSLGPAAGDQLVASLGAFQYGVLPGIKTIDAIADDVHQQHLNFSTTDQNVGVDSCKVAFLNSKGFGGNNATATVLAPSVVGEMLKMRHGQKLWSGYLDRHHETLERRQDYQASALKGDLRAIYHFGDNLIDENKLRFSDGEIQIPGFPHSMVLGDIEGFNDIVIE